MHLRVSVSMCVCVSDATAADAANSECRSVRVYEEVEWEMRDDIE